MSTLCRDKLRKSPKNRKITDENEHYELLSAKKKPETVLSEVEGRYSELPIETESGETSDST